MRNFEKTFHDQIDRYAKLNITEPTKSKIRLFAERMVKAKMKEHVHQIDNDVEVKRWITGVSGEMAVEKLLGVSFFDWSIGESRKYDVPDLKDMGINVGIKTVEYGKFPVIHKRVERPEIIVVKQGDRFYVCGVATVDVLRQCQDDTLILNAKLRARNVKTGFYGFDRLIAFKTLDELKEIVTGKKTIAS